MHLINITAEPRLCESINSKRQVYELITNQFLVSERWLLLSKQIGANFGDNHYSNKQRSIVITIQDIYIYIKELL